MEKSTEQKKIALSLLEGYRRANEIIRKEKKRRLVRLSKEESFREYDDLCKMWGIIKRDRLEKLEKQKILFLIKRREIFNKIGGLKEICEFAIKSYTRGSPIF